MLKAADGTETGAKAPSIVESGWLPVKWEAGIFL
jgi:hypothetical protein